MSESSGSDKAADKQPCSVCNNEFDASALTEVDGKLICEKCQKVSEESEAAPETEPVPETVKELRKLTVEEAKAYWNGSLVIVSVILFIWAFVSLGCSIFFKESLDKIPVGKVGLGFWMSQQGSIIVFVLLLVVYMILMNRHDDKHGFFKEDNK